MTTLLLGVVLASAWHAPTPPVLLAASETHEGTITSAGDGKLLVEDENGEDQEFEVTDKTKITRNEKEADLDDLQDGDRVKVKAERRGTGYLALSIEATSPE